LAPVAANAAEESKPTVTAVELHLPSGADPSGFPELIAVEVGQKLSLRTVRRSIERLFATGRLSDVVVRARPEQGGVALLFELTPKRRIVSYRVQGNRVLSDSKILAAAKLSAAIDFSAERVQEAVDGITAAYRRRGYEHPQITPEIRDLPRGLELGFSIREGEPTRISAITVAGSPGLPLNQILDSLNLEIGNVLDLEQVGGNLEKLRAVYRQKRFYRARIAEPVIYSGALGASVALPIFSGPRYEIRFRGNRSFRDQVMRAILDYDGTETLDRALIDRLVRRIATFYRYRGFHDAKVQAREVQQARQLRAALWFEIEEGLPVTVQEVAFRGHQALSAQELQQIVADIVRAKAPVPTGEVHPIDDPLELEGRTPSSARAAEPDPDPRTVFVEDAYQEAADTITQLYRERGFLEARVSLASFQSNLSGSARVEFEVYEGVQSYVREIAFGGFPQGFQPKIEAIKAGDPLRRSLVDQSRAALLRDMSHQGYLFTRVDAATELPADRRSARLTFQATPGPQVHVGRIIIQGLNRTHAEVVRANLQVRSGAVLDPGDLYETQRNLLLLGIFRQVGVGLIAPETAEQVKDVVVDLNEMPRLDGNILGGYSLAEGPQIGGDVLYPNLAGVGINVSARAKVNYVGWSTLAFGPTGDPNLRGLDALGGRANVSVQNPRIYSLLPLKLGAKLDLVAEKVFRPSYRFTRYSAVAGTDWTAFRWLTLSLQYEIEHDSVQAGGPNFSTLLPSLTPADQLRLRFPLGVFNLHSLRPGFALNFRDDVANPHKGLLVSGFAEVTHDLGATLNDTMGNRISDQKIFTLKLATSVTFYVPLSSRVVFALSARAGRIYQLDPTSVTIPPKRFFLGGAASMRGFPEDGVIPQDQRQVLHQQVSECRSFLNNNVGCTPAALALVKGNQIASQGGNLFTLGKAELRFPVIAPFDIGLFFETGNLWLDPHQYQTLNLRQTVGGGIRYGTPVGPLALDVGFNLFPDSSLNEPTFQIHFSIGLF